MSSRSHTCGAFPRDPFLGVSIRRIIVFRGLSWGSPIYGNYHASPNQSKLAAKVWMQDCQGRGRAFDVLGSRYMENPVPSEVLDIDRFSVRYET